MALFNGHAKHTSTHRYPSQYSTVMNICLYMVFSILTWLRLFTEYARGLRLDERQSKVFAPSRRLDSALIPSGQSIYYILRLLIARFTRAHQCHWSLPLQPQSAVPLWHPCLLEWSL